MNGRKSKELRRAAAGDRKLLRSLKLMARRRRHALAQSAAVPARRRKKAGVYSKPTWPKTDDQFLQSRPLIVVRPVRKVVAGRAAWWAAEMRRRLGASPKWRLDQLSLLERAR